MRQTPDDQMDSYYQTQTQAGLEQDPSSYSYPTSAATTGWLDKTAKIWRGLVYLTIIVLSDVEIWQSLRRGDDEPTFIISAVVNFLKEKEAANMFVIFLILTQICLVFIRLARSVFEEQAHPRIKLLIYIARDLVLILSIFVIPPLLTFLINVGLTFIQLHE